jgi:hypothetical protein
MPCDFQRYLAWLYSKKLSAVSEEMDEIIDLYILGDVLDDIHLRNAAIELLFTLIYSQGFPSLRKLKEDVDADARVFVPQEVVHPGTRTSHEG